MSFKQSSLGLLAALVGLLVILGFAWLHYTHSPQYALRQVTLALRQRNRLLFERFVDVDSISSTTVNELMDHAVLTSFNESESGFGALGAALGSTLVSNLKPALTNQLKESILSAVESGRFDEVFAPSMDTTRRNLTLAVVARNAAAARWHYAGLAPMQQEGDAAIMGLRLKNDMLDTTLVLRFRMHRLPNGWRIAAPDNLPTLLQTLDDAKERRLAVVNKQSEAAIAATIEATPVLRSIRTYEFANDDVILTTAIRNIGRDTVVAVLLRLYAGGDSIDRSDAPFGTTVPIAPGQSGFARFVLDYNQFMDWHRKIRYLDLRAVPWAVITRHGPKSDTIFEYDSWAEYASRQ